ncbi:unnamed protein product [Pleuronectes platessa]|uniref:Uncharacterized protein n=1 Tax=Pleuronectes platessa TaxID=8262 RepID=A0A9N7TPE5_PLEPL|nr:unnamed protein product [Pleuronectes platessa]
MRGANCPGQCEIASRTPPRMSVPVSVYLRLLYPPPHHKHHYPHCSPPTTLPSAVRCPLGLRTEEEVGTGPWSRATAVTTGIASEG